MKYKGVIFDFNGTLFIDEKYNVKAWKKVAIELRGTEITDVELNTKINGVPNVKVVEYLNNDYKSRAVEISKYKESLYRKYCLEDRVNLHLVDGAIDFFEYLKEKHIPFTIATASIKENVDFFIKIFKLEKWFDVSKIVYDNGDFNDKCNMYKQAAQNIDVDIDECLIIEDSLSGVVNAQQAGCKQIALINNNSNLEKKLKFVKKIDKLNDLYK